MTPQQRKILELAVKEMTCNQVTENRCRGSLNAIREWLAQPEQELVPIADYMNLMEKYVALLSAQPEQEPVGEVINERGEVDWISFVPSVGSNLYITPPQRTWVGLTDEDKQTAFDDTQEGGGFWEFADAIEAKLKEKNT